jgi:gamma-glutamyltranspeptidase/glutathione hydrolase
MQVRSPLASPAPKEQLAVTERTGLRIVDQGVWENRQPRFEPRANGPRWQQDHFGRHTTHVAAADSEGNWVAITATVNMGFGSKVIVPATGVIVNNQMDDFSVAPGAANAFGLLGAEANAIAPGKRPLSSMSPTIVLQDGRPILTLGAASGPKIIPQVLMTILYHLALGTDPSAALAAPRIHHPWRSDKLLVEKSLDPAIVAALEKLGHRVDLDGEGLANSPSVCVR